jgi:hypothetical protein
MQSPFCCRTFYLVRRFSVSAVEGRKKFVILKSACGLMPCRVHPKPKRTTLMNHLSSHAQTDLECQQPQLPEQMIRERAYQIYRQRGAKGGNAEGDWLTAEAELKELKQHALAAASRFF